MEYLYLLNFLLKVKGFLLYLLGGSLFKLLSIVALFIVLFSFLEESEILLSIFVPIMIYSNPDADRYKILSDCKDNTGTYMWTHKESGKRYVGSAVNLSNRLKNYFFKSYLERSKSMYICNALLHHGFSAFTLTIYEYIEISNLSKEEAKKLILELEQFYFDVLQPEYNILKTAGSSLGFTHSSETKALMSLAKSGKNHPMFGKKRHNHPREMYAKTHSTESIALMRKAKLGILFTEEHKRRIWESRIKKVFTYTLDPDTKTLILHKSFNNNIEAMEFFDCSRRTISNYLNTNKLYKKQWILSSSKLD